MEENEDKKPILPCKRSAEKGPSTQSEADDISDNYTEENISKKLKTEEEDEANHFAELYEDAFDFIQTTMEVSEEELEDGIEAVIQSFKYPENQFSDVDYTVSKNLCAYFRRFSQLSTELSRSKILLALEECEELQSCFNQKALKVMCIGGGTGFEIVGLCSALHEKTICKRVRISVVDTTEGWQSFLYKVEAHLREGDFGRSSEMFQKTNASIEFFGTASENIEDDSYAHELMSADVVLMHRVLSILPYPSSVEKLVKIVVARMKKGAMLLHIDTPERKDIFNDNPLEMLFSSFPITGKNKESFIIKRRHKQMAYESLAKIEVLKKI